MVVLDLTTSGNDINGGLTKDGGVSISPGELLLSLVHVRVNVVGRRGMLHSGKGVDGAHCYQGNSSLGDLSPLHLLGLQLCNRLFSEGQ